MSVQDGDPCTLVEKMGVWKYMQKSVDSSKQCHASWLVWLFDDVKGKRVINCRHVMQDNIDLQCCSYCSITPGRVFSNLFLYLFTSRTTNAFFHRNPKLLGLGRQFGRISFGAFGVFFGQFISTHFQKSKVFLDHEKIFYSHLLRTIFVTKYHSLWTTFEINPSFCRGWWYQMKCLLFS